MPTCLYPGVTHPGFSDVYSISRLVVAADCAEKVQKSEVSASTSGFYFERKQLSRADVSSLKNPCVDSRKKGSRCFTGRCSHSSRATPIAYRERM